MKKNILYLFFPLFVCVFCASGCLYKEGPFISFLTAKARISYPWKFSKVTYNGLNVLIGNNIDSINYSASSISFDKNGRFAILMSSLKKQNAGLSIKTGNWYLENDERNIVIKYDNDSLYPTRSYEIFKLLETDFRFRYINERGDKTEYFLVPTK